MDTLYFDSIASTQKYLIEELKSSKLEAPIAILAEEQKRGIGSRNNSWSGNKGNFFASFALRLDDLPKDLVLASASIYFSFIMKEVLKDIGEKVWLKWPNDFYISDDKVGGTITKIVNNTLVCGIGLNLKKPNNGFTTLQSDISPKKLLEKYLLALEKFPEWKHVFSQYRIEFELSRKFSVNIENYQMSLVDASLQLDGSLIIAGKKVFSLR